MCVGGQSKASRERLKREIANDGRCTGRQLTELSNNHGFFGYGGLGKASLQLGKLLFSMTTFGNFLVTLDRHRAPLSIGRTTRNSERVARYETATRPEPAIAIPHHCGTSTCNTEFTASQRAPFDTGRAL